MEKITLTIENNKATVSLVDTISAPKGARSADGTGRSKGRRVFCTSGDYDEFFCGEGARRLRGAVAGRDVTITGRGSVEAYFALGYYLTLAGAGGIVFIDPRKERYTIKAAVPSEPCGKPWLSVVRDGGMARCEFTRAPDGDGDWPLSDEAFRAPARLPAGTAPLFATGKAAVAMYAHLGVSAAIAGVREAYVSKPAYTVRLTPDSVRDEVLPGTRNGLVVGVVGDPNSGKSVFSRAFYKAVRSVFQDGRQAWVYDCDLASPTPDWYLAGKTAGDGDHATDDAAKAVDEAREKIKANWDDAMQRRVQEQLHAMRSSLDLTIADMPGGIHRDKTNYHRRIPDGRRADMMNECDAFIVVCTGAKPKAFDAWRRALARRGMADRIVARIDSCNYLAPPSARPMPGGNVQFRCEMDGLRRESDSMELGREMARALGSLIRHLASHKTKGKR